MKKGLNREIVIAEAVSLVNEQGYEHLSLRELAARLCIKPASLYNHIEGIEDVQISIAEHAGERLERALFEAVAGKEMTAAFRDGAHAYLDFARYNKELYKALISVPKSDSERTLEVGRKTFSVFREIIHGLRINDNESLHLIRMLRSLIHGFIELCENGFMTHGTVGRKDTFDFAVDEFIGIVRRYATQSGAGIAEKGV